MQQDFLENNLIILTKQTLDVFLKQENPGELISLYTFYYYTAKWQETNQPKCTTDYVAQGLHWNRHKVVKVKKQLIEFGLINNVRVIDQDTKRVKGYYIKINYILKKDTVSEPQCAQNPPSGNAAKNNSRPSVPKSDRVDSKHTNALSADNLNALSAGNYIYDETKVPSQKENSKYEEFFEEIWKSLKPNKNDRKDKVSMSRKKALYKMGAERVKKAIKVYLATQDEKYMHKRDNILNFVIDNYLDKEISDFKQPNQNSKQNTPPEDYDYSDFGDIGFCF